MAKIKLSKNELKQQKDSLKRFLRYLPTLILKKQQLQFEIRRIETQLEEKKKIFEKREKDLFEWIAVLSEDIDLNRYIDVTELVTSTANIAGIDVPVFERITFRDTHWDLFLSPLWIDRAIEALKVLVSLRGEIDVLEEQLRIIAHELRVTSQRINLFEKVKIPQARENIRKIQIYLGDQQVAAVVRGKISKKKIVRSQSA
ncbi:MAG: V-type ATP synthase subunit D [Spirochaetales bacterium]|nr:V-type ATP synthase subunit D [Spirochaetales bacterium]